MAFMIATPIYLHHNDGGGDDGFRPDPNLDRVDRTPELIWRGEDVCVVTNVQRVQTNARETRPAIMTRFGPVAVFVVESQKTYLIMLTRNELLERTYQFVGRCTEDLADATRSFLMWQNGRDTREEWEDRRYRLIQLSKVVMDVTKHFEAGYLYHRLRALLKAGVATELVEMKNSAAPGDVHQVIMTEAFATRNSAALEQAHVQYYREPFTFAEESDEMYM